MTVKTAIYPFGLLCVLIAGCGGNESPPPPAATPPPSAPAVVRSATDANSYEEIRVTDGGTLTGIITVSGRIPTLARRVINKDTQVCGSGTRPSQELIVSDRGGLENAVVIVQGVSRGKAMSAMRAQINQSGCEYDPHVQVIPVQAEMTIANSDPVLHNIHFYQGDDDLFNIAQPLKGQTNQHRIEKAGFVYAECDVHGWMKGYVAVVDNPYVAVTDADGKFSIGDIPPGTYLVKVWHEYLGEQVQSVTVVGKAETALNVDLKQLLEKMHPPASTNAPGGAPATGAGASAPSAPQTPRVGSGKAVSGEVTLRMVSEGGSFRFEPGDITVKVGTTVTWLNDSDNRHTATDDPKFEKAAGMAILPPSGEPWTTPFIANSQQASHTFTTPGKYQYFCRNHGQFGMVATITVVP